MRERGREGEREGEREGGGKGRGHGKGARLYHISCSYNNYYDCT